MLSNRPPTNWEEKTNRGSGRPGRDHSPMADWVRGSRHKIREKEELGGHHEAENSATTERSEEERGRASLLLLVVMLKGIMATAADGDPVPTHRHPPQSAGTGALTSSCCLGASDAAAVAGRQASRLNIHRAPALLRKRKHGGRGLRLRPESE